MPTKPGMEIEDVFEEKARAGDGAYAIALALLRLADVQEADSKSRSMVSQKQMRG
jgi:hypothetical protein